MVNVSQRSMSTNKQNLNGNVRRVIDGAQVQVMLSIVLGALIVEATES